ncbi:L,D-transpeptidase family protein, partial [Salipiger sp. PrR007]|uniref:L,D-transpeptidase family protein n=1 Tax=Salipiger sp. PrR007 TaxID=2706884 RepID=UPI001EEECBF3
MMLNRRMFAKGAALGGLSLMAGPLAGQHVFKEVNALHPGEFTWHPERSPYGPVSVVVSIDEQRVHVYRGGIRIAVSTCSTGKPGHETPTGVFVVLQKDRDHHSSTYNNAPMPNMNRLTWGGIALHAGNLPGYPASHGCIRLPLDFSARLFEVTHLGTPVIIGRSGSAPQSVVHPGLILGIARQSGRDGSDNQDEILCRDIGDGI